MAHLMPEFRNARFVLRCVVMLGSMTGPALAVQEVGAEPEVIARIFAGHAQYLAEQAVAREHGEGVPRDMVQASALYCEAARLGNVKAMYSLGWMYANGRGLPRNDAFASTLFAMAAFLGDGPSLGMLRFTGEYTGAVPDCLEPPQHVSLDSVWSAEAHIRGLPAGQREVARLVVELAPTYQVSPRLALAIAITESRLNPAAVSPKNAMGVMQLIPDTAARFNVRDAFDPRENIRGGLAYLRWLLAYFRGDVALAAAGYNAGEGAVDRYRGVPPYRETQGYVARILDFVERRDHPYDSRVVEPSASTPLPSPQKGNGS